MNQFRCGHPSLICFLRNSIAVMIMLFSASQSFSQKIIKKTTTNKATVIRCGTMEYYAEMKKLDPLLEAKARQLATIKLKERSQRGSNANRPLGTQAVIVVPIVFHVVGNASVQSFASDAAIQRQVDVLNRDFAGLNPDAVKLPAAFKAVFAHCNIRFALAKRTPVGTSTNGIERRVTNRTFTSASSSYNTQLKHTAAGGLDQWDGSKYYNVWLTDFTDGLLGVATFPNVNPPLDNEQGVAINYGSIDQPCGSPFAGAYDLGRTLVHETGHYFYLFHIWGDDGTDCTGSDFDTPYGPLPTACKDDTPNQAGATDGCLSGIQTDACSSSAPGFMYQNFMDYTSDPCYGMFTIGQACRAEAALDLYRPSLLTSDGLIPVTGNIVNNDIRVSEILNPDSRGYACGTTTSICSTPFSPQVLIVNDGDAPVTSLTFDVQVDGVSIAMQPWAGNLQPADFAYVSIDQVNAPAGTHVLTIKTINPNGQADGRPGNDSANASFSVLSIGIPVPTIAESFESAVFPPIGWRIDNVDGGSVTWARTTNAANPGTASVYLNCFDYPDTGQVDYLISPKLLTAGYDSLVINFNVAYAKYSNDPVDWDGLEIVYSDDCGATWKPTGYNKSGSDLETNGGVLVTTGFTPNAAQWRSESVKLSLCNLGPEVTIGFKSTNHYGNNLYLDNIQFDQYVLPDPNVELRAIINPNGLYCNGNLQPSIVIFNKGNTTLTNVTFSYNIDNGAPVTFNWTGNLPKCSAPIAVSLPALTVQTGNHLFTVYTTSPNGVADKVPANDTIRSAFSIIPIVNGAVTEGFEGNTFPPLNWGVQNFDNSTTWVRTINAARIGAASMVINNFDYASSNTTDRFVSPRIGLGTFDSAFVSFDYAHSQGKQYPGSTVLPLDTLELVLTTDCGITTTTIFKKWGEDLQTIHDPNYSTDIAFRPAAITQWRNEKIDISPLINNAPDFQIYFVAKSNRQNNLYIDNINIYGRTLPARLKSQGYLIYPVPFSTTFRIHHLLPPVDLRAAQVFNAAGQLVWDKRYNGGATTEEMVDLKNLAKGIYILKLVYTNKTEVEKIIKN
ncbi:MAG: choice-of-anchor J domain-containing protein [Ferruginibacter sp.]